MTPHDADALHATALAHEHAGTFEEGLALLAPALGDDAPARLRLQHARLLWQAARFDLRRRDEALVAAEEAHAAAERSGDPAALAEAVLLLARVRYLGAHHGGEGDFDRPMELARRALALAEAAGDARVISEAAHYVGLAHERRAELSEADAQHGRAYALAAAAGLAAEQAHAARHLGFLAFFLHHDVDAALARFEESLALFEASGCRWLLPLAVKAVGDAYFHGKHDQTRAEQQYRRALAVAEALGREAIVGEVHFALGVLFEATGRPAEARAAYTRSLSAAEAVDHRRQAAEASARLVALSASP